MSISELISKPLSPQNHPEMAIENAFPLLDSHYSLFRFGNVRQLISPLWHPEKKWGIFRLARSLSMLDRTSARGNAFYFSKRSGLPPRARTGLSSFESYANMCNFNSTTLGQPTNWRSPRGRGKRLVLWWCVLRVLSLCITLGVVCSFCCCSEEEKNAAFYAFSVPLGGKFRFYQSIEFVLKEFATFVESLPRGDSEASEGSLMR